MHQPIHKPSLPLSSLPLSSVIDMERLGILIRIFGREMAADECRVEWLIIRCRLPHQGSRHETIDWARSDYSPDGCYC